MNPEPLRWGTAKPYTSYFNSRSASYDAALTLQPSQAFTITQVNAAPAPVPGPFVYPAKPAVSSFHDAKGYYAGFYYGAPCQAGYICYADRDGSAVIPAIDKYSVRIADYAGNPLYALYGAAFSPSWLGSGNPGDDGVQYGLHIALTQSTGETATIKTWNALYEMDGSVKQTTLADPLRNGDKVEVHVMAQNVGGAVNAFAFVPLSPNVAYVADSATDGAYPVTAAAAASLAAKHGLNAADLPQGGEEEVIGVAYEAPELGVGGMIHFSFQVQAVEDAGTISHTALISGAGMLVKKLASNPVTIRPWTPATATIPAAADAYLHNGVADSVHGIEPFLHVHMHAPGYDGLRTLIGFDVSNIKPEDKVTKATLSLYVRGSSGGAVDGELRAYEVTTPWNERSVSWLTPWVKPGGDFVSDPVGSVALNKDAVGHWVSIDVTPLVAKWVADPASNNGVMVRLQKISSITGYQFNSKNHWAPTNPPKLDVAYSMP